MDLLVLGGTLFLGRAVVEAALVAGDRVTLFNRGRTNPGLFDGVEHVIGDRDDDLALLTGRTFDAVVDTSAYFPRQVTTAAEVLGDGVGHYTFVSSISVYADHSRPGADEAGTVESVADPDTDEVGSDYGGLKALCERALTTALPGRVHNVRAGLIVGPHDNTERFGYWVRRLAIEGGEVLAPEPRDLPVQFIDVRDLAGWILHAAREDVTGTFNATGAPGRHTLGSLLDQIHDVSPVDAELIWVGEEFLVDAGVEPWSGLPLWLPPSAVPELAGFTSYDTGAAVARGLTTRPLVETVAATRDTLAAGTAPTSAKDFGNPSFRAGLTPDREADLLDAWRSS